MFHLMTRYVFILIIIIVGISTISTPLTAGAYVSVKGYYRSNGTYVRSYVRSNPNGLKYDNYSYKPKQGLYNATYGTRSTTWDTPTYVTDPNYYKGKSLYESGLSSDNSYLVDSYSSPTYATSIKSIYGGTFYGTNLYCNSGYYKSNESCVKAPLNSYASMYSFNCDYGYEKSKNICTKIIYKPYVGIFSNSTSYTTIRKSVSYRNSTYNNVRHLRIYSSIIQRIAYNENLSCSILFPMTNQHEDVAMCSAYRKINNPEAWTKISRVSKEPRNTITQIINKPILIPVSSILKQNELDYLQSQLDNLIEMVKALQAQIK